MKTWYLYILECKDGTLYTGITTDVRRRLFEHNNSSKGAKYTRGRRPCKLLGYYPVGNRSQAQKKEYKIKKMSRKNKKKFILEEGTTAIDLPE